MLQGLTKHVNNFLQQLFTALKFVGLVAVGGPDANAEQARIEM